MNEMRYCRYVLEIAALRQTVHMAYVEDFHRLYNLLDRTYDDPELAYFSNMTFHYELAKLSGNETIVSYIERLLGLMIRGESTPIYRGSAYLGDRLPENGIALVEQPSHELHREIVGALVSRDLKSAVRYLSLDIYPDIKDSENLVGSSNVADDILASI